MTDTDNSQLDNKVPEKRFIKLRSVMVLGWVLSELFMLFLYSAFIFQLLSTDFCFILHWKLKLGWSNFV